MAITDQGSNGAAGNLVQGNLIGTDISGTKSLGNYDEGIVIADDPDINSTGSAASNLIGGTTPRTRNVISGNGRSPVPGNRYGIQFQGSRSHDNLVQGNFIGTDISGTGRLGNGEGVLLNHETRHNTIGGVLTGTRNVISGNQRHGIIIFDGATGNLVQGNFIGTDHTGTGRLGNDFSGVNTVQSPGNIIGGAEDGARNIISDNDYGVAVGLRPSVPISGKLLIGEQGVTVQGNYIGTDVAGSSDIGNRRCGVLVDVQTRENHS
ncbi:MAG TPA: hypothetical protein VJ464_25800 [Blastocatellia bacterium]|nr:hypothetical protein [Blastocatellia bacterium]